MSKIPFPSEAAEILQRDSRGNLTAQASKPHRDLLKALTNAVNAASAASETDTCCEDNAAAIAAINATTITGSGVHILGSIAQGAVSLEVGATNGLSIDTSDNDKLKLGGALIEATTIDWTGYSLWLKSDSGSQALFRGDLGPDSQFLANVVGTGPGQVNSNTGGTNWTGSTVVFNSFQADYTLRANGVFSDDYTDPGILALSDTDQIYSRTWAGWIGAPSYAAQVLNYTIVVDGTPDAVTCPVRVDLTGQPGVLVSIAPSGDITLGFDASAARLSVTGTVQASGKFDAGTTAPSHTTRTNYDGYLYATRFYGDGTQLTGVGLLANPLSQFAATTSAQLAATISDETGSGALVFASGATTSNMIVGTQSAGDNSTKAASTAYADSAVSTAVAGYVPVTRTVNGHALSANVTVTASDVGLGSVTNDAQTKAAIVPNTAPSAGQILVGNAGGTAYAPVAASGDVTIASTGAHTIGAGKVTNAMLAGSIAASKLVGTDIATVGTITAGTWNGTKVSEAYGGTNQSTYATGDILYASAANTLSKLAAGTNGWVLTLAAGVPSWAAASSGGITALTGDVTASGSGSVAATLATAQPSAHSWAALQTLSAGASIATGQTLDWNSDLYLTRRGAANLSHGAADAAAPVAQTISFQGARGGTDTNTAAVAATITGSLGTGTGTVGSLLFQTGTVAASGTTQHAAATRLTLTSTLASFSTIVAFPTSGTAGAPTLQIGATTTGIYADGGGIVTITQAGVAASNHASSRLLIPSGSYFAINSGALGGGGPDVCIGRSGANAVVFSGSVATAAGSATSRTCINKTVTTIADATATTVFTVTIPNAAHSASIRVKLVGSIGAGGAIGANEATGTIEYDIAVARTAGVNAVAGISAAFGSTTAAVAGATTITVAGTLGAVAGAVGASNTIAIQVTITKGGGASANHTCLAFAELLNANSTGVTIS